LELKHCGDYSKKLAVNGRNIVNWSKHSRVEINLLQAQDTYILFNIA